MFWFGGEAGVAFFFVLSGFIIHYIHRQDFDQPGKLLNYLRKRAVRIYPIYFIIFICVFVLAKATPSLRDTMPGDIYVLIKSLLLLPQDSKSVGGTGAPVLVVAWSLQYEILFYVAFATALLSRWIFYSIITIFILNLFLQATFGSYDFPRSFFASHLILLFGMGMLASSVVKRRFHLSYTGYLALVCSFAFATIAFVATQYRATYQKPLFDLAYGFVSAVLIFALARYDRQQKDEVKPNRFGVIGDSSYALYLIHFPLVSILSKIAVLALPKTLGGASVAFLFLVSGNIVMALIFNIFIERPILRLLTPNSYIRRSQFHFRRL